MRPATNVTNANSLGCVLVRKLMIKKSPRLRADRSLESSGPRTRNGYWVKGTHNTLVFDDVEQDALQKQHNKTFIVKQSREDLVSIDKPTGGERC